MHRMSLVFAKDTVQEMQRMQAEGPISETISTWTSSFAVYLNEWGIYVPFPMYYCAPKAFYNQHFTLYKFPVPLCYTSVDEAMADTPDRWRGERVIGPIQWMGIIRRPWLTPGLHPYSLREVQWPHWVRTSV